MSRSEARLFRTANRKRCAILRATQSPPPVYPHIGEGLGVTEGLQADGPTSRATPLELATNPRHRFRGLGRQEARFSIVLSIAQGSARRREESGARPPPCRDDTIYTMPALKPGPGACRGAPARKNVVDLGMFAR